MDRCPYRISIDEKTGWAMLRSCLGRRRKTTARTSGAILISLSGLAMAQAGGLDSTFATGGIFITRDTQAFDAVADAVALQSDGKIVAAGEISSLAGVLRLNPNGTLDS